MGLQNTSERNKTTMKQHTIIIEDLRHANYPAWVAPIRLQARPVGLAAAIDNPSNVPDRLLVCTLPLLTDPILDSIPTDAKSEAIHDNEYIKLYPLLRKVHDKFNRNLGRGPRGIGIESLPHRLHPI